MFCIWRDFFLPQFTGQFSTQPQPNSTGDSASSEGTVTETHPTKHTVTTEDQSETSSLESKSIPETTEDQSETSSLDSKSFPETTEDQSETSSLENKSIPETTTALPHEEIHQMGGGEHYEAIRAYPNHNFVDYSDYPQNYHDGDDHMSLTLQNQLGLISQMKHGRRYLMAQTDYQEGDNEKALTTNFLFSNSSSRAICSWLNSIFTITFILIFLTFHWINT